MTFTIQRVKKEAFLTCRSTAEHFEWVPILFVSYAKDTYAKSGPSRLLYSVLQWSVSEHTIRLNEEKDLFAYIGILNCPFWA